MAKDVWKCKKKMPFGNVKKVYHKIQPKLPTVKVLIEFAPSKSQSIFTVKMFSHLQMCIFGHFKFWRIEEMASGLISFRYF